MHDSKTYLTLLIGSLRPGEIGANWTCTECWETPEQTKKFVNYCKLLKVRSNNPLFDYRVYKLLCFCAGPTEETMFKWTVQYLLVLKSKARAE